MAGVLRVWSAREFSTAMSRLSEAGIQRSVAAISATRLQRARGQQREPQPALGPEALLRSEVVDVGLGDVDPGAAGGGGAVDHHQGVVGAPGNPPDRGDGAGRGLVVGPGVDIRVLDRGRYGDRAGVGGDHRRRGEMGRGGHGGGELGRELPEARMGAPAADQGGRRRRPRTGWSRRCRAPPHSPSGRLEQLLQPDLHLGDEPPDRGLPVRGAQQGPAGRGQRVQ